jgi:hypothetical protein
MRAWVSPQAKNKPQGYPQEQTKNILAYQREQARCSCFSANPLNLNEIAQKKSRAHAILFDLHASPWYPMFAHNKAFIHSAGGSASGPVDGDEAGSG